MTLYWYMHWFWITIILNVGGASCEEISNATTTHSTTLTESASHRLSKSMTMTPPITGAAKSSTVQSTKETSVIEQNVTSSILSNITYANATENATLVGSAMEETANESAIATSERVALGDSEAGTNLSAAGITGITLGCVSLVGIITAISYLIYRNRGFNRPQVLSDRCSNLDSSGYIDDTSIRDNSEEMYSLDNDSFLNSLEAMTIQNYWMDTVKHTKL